MVHLGHRAALVVGYGVLILSALLSSGCILGGEAVDTWSNRSSRLNVRRTWSARTATSIQQHPYFEQSLMLVKVQNQISSNILQIGNKIVFVEIRPQVSDESLEDDKPCSAWVTCRKLSSGKLIYRKPFEPGCEDHLDKYYQLVSIGGRVFIGQRGHSEAPYEDCVGVFWDLQEGQAIESSRLKKNQLPGESRYGNECSPFASDGEKLFVANGNGVDVDMVALEVPGYNVLWHQQVTAKWQEGWDFCWRQTEYANGVVLTWLTIVENAFRQDCQGGVFVVAVDASTGQVLWQKQTGLFPVWRS